MISEKPIEVKPQFHQGDRARQKNDDMLGIRDDEMRKRLKIQRFKQRMLQDAERKPEGGSTADREQVEFEARLKLINEVAAIKETRKMEIVRTVVQEQSGIANLIHISPNFAEKKVFHVRITNKERNSRLFKVYYNDPDEVYLENGAQEIDIVTEPEEWRAYCEEYRVPPPAGGSFEIIEKTVRESEADPSKVDRIYNFLLEAEEELTLFLRFQTFRRWDEEVSQSLQCEEILKQKPPRYFQQYVVKREIKFIVADSKGDQIDQSFTVVVDPRRLPVDQVFKFCERENMPTQILLPPLYCIKEVPPEV